MQPVLLLLPRIRPHRRTNEPSFGEAALGAVGIEPRNHVEGARIERARDALVLGVLGYEFVDQVQRGGAARPLHRVDVRFDEERGLVEGGARLRVRHGHEPDVAAFVRGARIDSRLHNAGASSAHERRVSLSSS